MHRRTKRFIAIGLLAAGLGIIAFLISSCTGAQEGDPPVSQTQEGAVSLVPGDFLLTSNRTHLSLCVDGAGGLSVSDAEVATVRGALEDAIAIAPEPPPEYGERQVSAGCPPATSLSVAELVGYAPNTGDKNAGVVIVGGADGPAAPSLHRLFVYFVPSEVYTASFAEEPYYKSTAEAICQGSACSGVTSGLYVRSSASSDLLRGALLDVINLVPFEADPSIDEEFWNRCALGTPETWCDSYDDYLRELEELRQQQAE